MSGIQGLTAITSEKQLRSVYVNLFSHKSLAIDYLANSCSVEDNITFTSCSDKESFYSGLNNHSQEQFNACVNSRIKNTYFLNIKYSSKLINISDLSEDLCRIKIQNKSIFILLIPDALLSNSSDAEINDFLKRFSSFSKKHTATVQLFIYGSLALSLLKPKLLTANSYLSGLATMTVLDEYRYSYLVDFWSNTHGVKSDVEYILSRLENGEIIAETNESAAPSMLIEDKADSERMYLSQDVLGDNTIPPKGVYIAENNKALLGLLQSPRASTVIFSCSSQSEIRQLTIDCFQLRNRAGNQLKIIIRETNQCLRYADEKFLMRAGVNLISPFQVPFVRFMTQVEAIQGQILMRPQPKSLEELLKYDQKFGRKGYLHNSDFTHYCRDVLNKSLQSNIRFALIRLQLLPGMNAEECLRLCHIRRDGDVITASDKALYVLFSAIRQDDINIALNNIFEFPVRDLFHSVRTFENHHDIEIELKKIDENEVIISEEVSMLATEKRIFSSKPTSNENTPSLYAVKKPLSVKVSA